MINFIYGRAGSGKTSRVCETAAEALRRGKRVFLIVPEQMAVDTEARMTELIGDASSLSLEILNFRRLCNRVFREYGGLSYNYISKSGKKLMMWQTLTELAPLVKTKVSVERGSVSRMLGAVNEFKAYRITPPALERAAKKLSEEPSCKGLSDKLFDLSLIFASYINLVGETCDDAADDLTKAAELLSMHDFFRGAEVCLDSFNGFTPQELAVIREIFRQAESVTVSLCLDAPPETSRDELFSNSAATAAALKRLCGSTGAKINETVLSGSHRPKSPALKLLEASLWSLDLTAEDAYGQEAPEISLIECPNLFSECEAVACDICRRMHEGAKWRDFAVITRGIDRYDGILDVTFEKYGIPHFISRRTDIKTRPVIKLMLLALTLKGTNFRTADMISYIKTGLCGITPDEVSRLENYAELWRIRGAARWNAEWDMNPAGYSVLDERSAALLDEINDIRERVMLPLCELHRVLDRAVTVREYSAALYGFLCALEIPKKLSAAARAQRLTDPVAAGETEQLFSVLIDALDELCTVMPDAETDTVTYAELLWLILDETDIGRIPGTVDEVVSGDASLLRAAGRHIYLIGANEGIFPLAPADDGIFTDSDRETLASVGVALSGGLDHRAVDERFYFYRALTSASNSVTVVWSSSDLSGHAQKPSFGVTRLRALFPRAKVIKYAALPIEDRLWGKAMLPEFIAETDGTPLGAALREYAAEDPLLSKRIGRLSIPLCDSDAVLSRETCDGLMPGDLALTQSRLDAYVLCHFSYFSKYILKLEEKKPAVFGAADIGTFIHHILENFVARAEEKGGISDITDAELDEMVEDIIADYMKTVCRIAPDFTGSRLAHLFARLRRSSLLLCKNIVSEFSRSRFKPAFFELPIRHPAPDEVAVEPLSVKLSDGSSAYLYGVADRVDILHHDDKYYVRVVDYKTGSKDFSLDDVSMGLNLQMLLYLFSIEKNGASPKNAMEFVKGSEIVPAGVLYFSAGVPTLTLDAEASPEEVEKMASDKLSRRGLLLDDAEVLAAMEPELSGTYLPIRQKKDGTFSGSDSLTSLEGFKTLLASIEETVKGIGNEIKRGNASAKPLRDKKHDACAFCEMHPFCRRKGN